MNHRLFEDWMITYYEDSEDGLTSQQVVELQEHLQECTSCQRLADAWKDVKEQLRSAVQIEPGMGFVTRFQARLDVERQTLQRRQSMALLGFSIAGAVLLLGSLTALAWPWLRTPDILLWNWLYRMFTVWSYIEAVQSVFSPLFQATVGKISLIWWVVIAGIISEIGVLWVVSLRMLTNPRRITQ